MSKQTESSLLIVSSVPALYQHLLKGAASYQELGTCILGEIKTAYAFRQVERVRELARMLACFPIIECQLIAQYYLVWCKCRELVYHPEILERIAEQTESYRAKALISRGTFELYQGKSETALYFYTEALGSKPTAPDYIVASRAIATAKSMEGFHASALRDLERLLPLLRFAEPLTYFEVMNSYAVELLATNRLYDAQDVSLGAVSSPYGPFYSEWQETLDEANSKRKRSSIITVPPPQENEEAEPESKPQDIFRTTRMQMVIEFMNTNLRRKVSLSDLANVAYLSPSHFSRVFKIQTGLSPGEYLISLRMEKARDLLTTSLLSIKEVMALVGYETRSNFVRHFRKYFDLPPSEYRKRSFTRV
jgi:AraC-like DNA-binding protein